MYYTAIEEGILIERVNRFVAYVSIGETVERVHVKNTGRCKELLIPGSSVILEKSNNPNRKTKYSLIAVFKGETLVNIDSQAPNAVALEALQQGVLSEIGQVTNIKKEQTFHRSRFDLFYERNSKPGFIEVKGVTLEKENDTFFPDAPTSRGTKHLLELVDAVTCGFEASVLFVVQMDHALTFQVNQQTDPAFAKAFYFAHSKGVQCLAYNCSVEKNSLVLHEKVQILF